MPQLDPGPWFSTLLFSWAVFMAVIPPKVMAYELPYEPVLDIEKVEVKSWNWQWH
uniref:ATP synthase complex subunit 8 n=1 Tax=Sternoptyx diaphana TaxID=81873 RepID=A0A7L8XFQ2_9TELE|nr:ATP synthase F0 subunit 8 [Sternoptyx diaphana]QOH91616.1 ATP synthase F0 subunit 8 [Sternoptyx diaphana]WNH38354.1 ATP synthase F0 subunit 8 [Sternoptyx diaphana]